MNRYEKDFTIHLGALGEDTYENETGAGIDASEETVEFESPRREEVKSMEEDFMDIRGELSEDDGISAKKGTKAEKESQINEIDLSSPSDANCDSDEPFIDASKIHPEILQKFLDDFHLKMEDLPYLHSMEDVIELSEIRYRKMHPEIFEKPFSERAARAIYRLHL